MQKQPGFHTDVAYMGTFKYYITGNGDDNGRQS